MSPLPPSPATSPPPTVPLEERRTLMWKSLSAACEKLPPSTPYKPHGRDLTGLDCIGVVLFLLRGYDPQIDTLDIPYGARDERRPDRAKMIARRLELRFDEVMPGRSGGCRDGDVLLLGRRGRENHMAVVMNSTVIQMGGVKQGQARIRVSRLRDAMPFVGRVFRHKTLCEHPPETPPAPHGACEEGAD